MLTYDQIWSTFLDDYKVNDADLPQTSERIYQDIHNAVRKLNNRLRLNLICKDDIEAVEGTNCNDHLILIAQYIRLIYLNNAIVLYTSLYQPISQDVGIKNYSSQMVNLREAVLNQESDIEDYIFNMREDFI